MLRFAVAALGLLVMAATAEAQNGPIGSWDFTTISPEGQFTSELVIRKDGDKLVALGKSPQGERPYDSISVDGSKITLVITISYNGSPMVITYTGRVDQAKMDGEADFGGLATGTWSAVARKPQ